MTAIEVRILNNGSVLADSWGKWWVKREDEVLVKECE
jgi:hypothetical protein